MRLGVSSGRLSDYPGFVRATWGPPRREIRKDPLDVKYPHMCFNPNCKRKLNFKELWEANAKEIFVNNKVHHGRRKWDFECYLRMKKLWRSQVIQFYCCDCFRGMERFEKGMDVDPRRDIYWSP